MFSVCWFQVHVGFHVMFSCYSYNIQKGKLFATAFHCKSDTAIYIIRFLNSKSWSTEWNHRIKQSPTLSFHLASKYLWKLWSIFIWKCSYIWTSKYAMVRFGLEIIYGKSWNYSCSHRNPRYFSLALKGYLLGRI